MRHGCLIAIVALVLVACAGCGNVYLKGEALTAAETSAMDAFQAVQRAEAPPAATQPPEAIAPPWMKAYLEENFKQWRSFVRSAHKDTNWGPKLPGEPAGG